MVVKRVKPDTGERGVLVVKYTDAMYRLPAIFDVAKLARDYRLVLEPSWWGYQDVVFLMYAEAGIQGVVQAPREPDFRFIEKLGGDLVPVAIGAGDWVDPADFSPRATQDRTFDLVMVSGWSPVKRHDLLCRALQSVREQCGRQLKAALVGYPQGWSRHEIESLLESYRVRHQCHIFENIKHKRVAEILGNSKLYLLLSSAEGANKALYEALFCDTPVIVYDRHRGVNHSHINSMTGLSFGKRPLTSTIIEALEGWESFDARAWALDHTGWQNSTKTVNRLLRRMAQEKEEPWTRDIDPKKNSPNLQYAEGNGPEKFAEEYDRLQSYLRTARSSSGLVY